MTMPTDSGHSVIFGIDDGSASGRQVFVDQYSGDVLGSTNPDGGIVGLANRLHGTLNNDRVTVDLPTVSALWDDGAVMRPYVVGDLVLELAGIWTLVLVASGLFLWWPRKARRAATASTRSVLRREAFVLTQIAGLSYAEAADVVGCPVGTIRSRMARARADLVEVVAGVERG